MEPTIRRKCDPIYAEEQPAKESVLTAWDALVTVVVGSGIDDYSKLEKSLRDYIDPIIDEGVVFAIAQNSNEFLDYMLRKRYRACKLPVGQEYHLIKRQSICVYIVSKNTNTGQKIKHYCDDNSIPSLFYIAGNSMTIQTGL